MDINIKQSLERTATDNPLFFKNDFPGSTSECAWCQPRDCRDVQELGFTTSGLFHVTPVGTFSGFDVWCDLDTEDGGWLVCT